MYALALVLASSVNSSVNCWSRYDNWKQKSEKEDRGAHDSSYKHIYAYVFIQSTMYVLRLVLEFRVPNLELRRVILGSKIFYLGRITYYIMYFLL